jgi:hypothetical protein
MQFVKALLKMPAQPLAVAVTEDMYMVDIADIQPGTC